MTDTTLDEQRDAALDRLAAIRRDLGATILDGGVPPAELAQAHAEAEARIIAIDSALAERTRREREAAARELAEQRARILAEARVAEAARLEAVERAETACRELRAALAEALARADEARDRILSLGHPLPIGWDKHEAEKRLSGLISLVLGGVAGRPDRFGDIDLHRPPDADPDAPWRDAEAAAGARLFAPFEN